MNVSLRVADESTLKPQNGDTVRLVNQNHDERPADSAPPNTPKDDPLAWALNDEEKQVWEAMLDFRKHHPLAFASLKTSGEDGADAVRQALMEENRELWRRLRLLRDAMRLTDWLLLHYDYPEMKDWFDD